MILKNDKQEIKLVIEGYEYPEPELNNFWDYNWLMIYCEENRDGKIISGRFACFTTTELKRLQILLEKFLNKEIECVEWNWTEPNCQILLQKDYTLEIFFYSECFPCVDIAFKKKASYKDIKIIIDFCIDSLLKYPVRKVELNDGI